MAKQKAQPSSVKGRQLISATYTQIDGEWLRIDTYRLDGTPLRLFARSVLAGFIITDLGQVSTLRDVCTGDTRWECDRIIKETADKYDIKLVDGVYEVPTTYTRFDDALYRIVAALSEARYRVLSLVDPKQLEADKW